MSIQTLVGELQRWQSVAILIARVAVGSLFFISGSGKLFVLERRQQMRSTLQQAHIPFVTLNVWFVSSVEFLFGLCLFLGLLTPLACMMLAGVMVVALITTKLSEIKASSIAEWLGEFLYLPETLYLVILFWLFLSGPGRFSLDRILFHSA